MEGSGDTARMNAVVTEIVPTLDEPELTRLRHARELLENPGIAAQLANVVGAPMEYVMARRLPASVTRLIESTTRAALEQSLRLATATLRRGGARPAARTRVHTFAAAAAGAAGGAFGFAGLAVELPVTTTMILRSIADIARSHGEDLDDPAVTLACFEVLTMGGRSASDDGTESGYFAARAVLAQQVAAAAEYIAVHGVVNNTGPAIVQLLASVTRRDEPPRTSRDDCRMRQVLDAHAKSGCLACPWEGPNGAVPTCWPRRRHPVSAAAIAGQPRQALGQGDGCGAHRTL